MWLMISIVTLFPKSATDLGKTTFVDKVSPVY